MSSKKATNIFVKPRRNESQDRLIRRFIKKVKKSGLIEEVKKRKYYLKPSITTALVEASEST